MSLTIGIDVGGTKILGGVVDPSGRVLAKARRDTPGSGGLDLLSAIANVAKELARDRKIVAMGLSIAGFVSSDRSTMLATPNISGLDGVNLQAPLEEAIQLPVHIENDANAAAWGEAIFGAGRGCNQLMMLTIGTGIGGGIVIDGELYRGADGTAAEFGHIRMVPDGLRCGCGRNGCLEQYASGNALLRYARDEARQRPGTANQLLALGDGTPEGIQGSHVTQAALQGDAAGLAAFAEVADWLGSGLASLSVVLDPERIVIGGGVIAAGEVLLEPMRAALLRYLPYAGKYPLPKIVPAALGNDAGLVGVADLVR